MHTAQLVEKEQQPSPFAKLVHPQLLPPVKLWRQRSNVIHPHLRGQGGTEIHTEPQSDDKVKAMTKSKTPMPGDSVMLAQAGVRLASHGNGWQRLPLPCCRHGHADSMKKEHVHCGCRLRRLRSASGPHVHRCRHFAVCVAPLPCHPVCPLPPSLPSSLPPSPSLLADPLAKGRQMQRFLCDKVARLRTQATTAGESHMEQLEHGATRAWSD